MNVPATTQDLFTEIRELILKARQHVATQVNTELLATYWQIGRMIVEHEQNHQERADYGKQAFKSAHSGIWPWIFTLQFAKYARFLSHLSKMPDTVWQINLVPLLRIAVHLRRQQT